MTCNLLRRDDFLAVTNPIPKVSDSIQFVTVAALRCEISRTVMTVVATESQLHVFTQKSVLGFKVCPMHPKRNKEKLRPNGQGGSWFIRIPGQCLGPARTFKFFMV